jgi:Fis family transcriptional regulator, factor for inversion stimulation protein
MQQTPTTNNPIYSRSITHSKTDHKRVQKTLPLHIHVEQALNTYLMAADGQPVTELYHTLLTAIEPPLLKVILKFCKTQDEAAKMLGLSRATLRKKLKKHQMM